MSWRIPQILATATVLCLGSGVLWQATDGLRAFTAEGARRINVARQPVKIDNVELTDFSGQSLTVPDGRITLFEFIYTTCPTVCQAAGDEFARLNDRLSQFVGSGSVRLVSVSFDPVRDDQERLEGYAELHRADGQTWTVAKPLPQALPGLLKAFGVKVIPDEYGGYQHNTAIHVVDQSGHLVRVLDADDIDGAVKAVKALL